MQDDNPRVRSLLRQAERNREAGKLAAAETLYRQIVDEAPQSSAAWLGLAQVSLEPETKREAYQRVLALEPENDEARAAVSALQEGAKSDSTALEQPAPALDPPQPEAVIAPPAPRAKAPQPAAVAEVSSPTSQATAGEVEELVCYRHPARPTSLRCYKCSRPICSECTHKTPVGYLCPVCYREAEDAFYNSRPADYLVAALVAFPVSLLAGYLVMRLSGGFFFILILLFAGGAVGSLIGRITKRAIGRRRGRYIPHLVAVCVIIGVVIPALPLLLPLLMGNIAVLTRFIGPGVYLATATGSAFYWAR